VLIVLTIIFCEEILFWLYLLGVLETSYAWIGSLSQIGEDLCYFVEYVSYTFNLYLFSFFNVHDLQALSFNGVAE
jgi:hypothetical protein